MYVEAPDTLVPPPSLPVLAFSSPSDTHQGQNIPSQLGADHDCRGFNKINFKQQYSRDDNGAMRIKRGEKILDPMCFDLAIAKPNRLINTDLLIISCNFFFVSDI